VFAVVYACVEWCALDRDAALAGLTRRLLCVFIAPPVLTLVMGWRTLIRAPYVLAIPMMPPATNLSLIETIAFIAVPSAIGGFVTRVVLDMVDESRAQEKHRSRPAPSKPAALAAMWDRDIDG
jgi:hypothetical protein